MIMAMLPFKTLKTRWAGLVYSVVGEGLAYSALDVVEQR